jgi:hypothetical protein
MTWAFLAWIPVRDETQSSSLHFLVMKLSYGPGHERRVALRRREWREQSKEVPVKWPWIFFSSDKQKRLPASVNQYLMLITHLQLGHLISSAASGSSAAAQPFGYLTSRLAGVPPVWRPLYIGGVGKFFMASTRRRDLRGESIRATG